MMTVKSWLVHTSKRIHTETERGNLNGIFIGFVCKKKKKTNPVAEKRQMTHLVWMKSER